MEKDGGIGAVTLLARRFFDLIRIKLMQEQKLGDDDIAKEFGMHPFRFKKLGYSQQAKAYSFIEIDAALERIGETDRMLKSSSLSPKLLFDSLIVDICIKKQPSRSTASR